ncbi:MAG: peptidase M16, partial [Clostridia bacterium]|nr:peptidase M16 [Clostridia bacterium]
MQIGQMYHGFLLERVETVADIESKAYLFSHPKSGAKLMYLENNDVEKAFSIAFKTLPEDSTGVFHILEHSVLCGSDKYPVKEPFVNLLKTSMQTFLNAMTFPDKTMY